MSSGNMFAPNPLSTLRAAGDNCDMWNVNELYKGGKCTPCPGKNGPPKQNAVKCTVYNTI